MKLMSAEIVRAKLEAVGSEVHYVHVTEDGKAMITHTSNLARKGALTSLPALFVTCCVSGGGRMSQTTNFQTIEGDIGPGTICIAPPGSYGEGSWPEMQVITFGLTIECVAEAFGKDWPLKLNSDLLSRTFHDPLVEATMMDMGYARAGKVSDAGLLHAAHMITHQLLDQPFTPSTPPTEVAPLDKASLAKVQEIIQNNIDRHITVSEMANAVGISRYHFSRRFKAATSQSPLQFALTKKLEYAAAMLEADEERSVMTITQMVGFSNPAYFARKFSTYFGLSPRSWRSSRRR